MSSRQVIQPFFLTKEDEEQLLKQLVAAIPSMRLVDGERWTKATPPVKASFSECMSGFVYLWDSDKVQTLPCVEMNGYYQGPTSGIVIQLMRSKVSDGVLLSGQIGVGFTNKNAWMSDFIRRVVEVAKGISCTALTLDGARPAEPISVYVVGSGAKAFAKGGGRLKHVTADAYYLTSPNS